MIFRSAFVRQNRFWSCFQKYSLSNFWRNLNNFRIWQFSSLENWHFLTIFPRIKYVFIWSEVSRLNFNISFQVIFQKNFRPNCIRIRKMAHSAGCNGFATSRGSYFIPRGEAPRDETTPKGCSKTFASQILIVQKYFCMDLLNKTLQWLKLVAKLFLPWNKKLC